MTQIIVRPRQAGKTHAAVEWVLEGEATDSYPGWTRVLLTQSITEADRVRQAFPELDYRQVFSFNEWRNARLGAKPVEVAVDNADMILASLLGQTPSRITMTGGVI